jgi:hypothetical protein
MKRTAKSGMKKASRAGVTRKLGDKVERVGEKLKAAGARKMGRAIYRMGNKIEHISGER